MNHTHNTNECICNFSGKSFILSSKDIYGREECHFDGYNSRFRAIWHILSKRLYGKQYILNQIKKSEIKGLGMSDGLYSKDLESKYNYTNTFYHQSPYLDINNPIHVNNFSDLDYLISSDVFEHISIFPSILQAFKNMRHMLKKNGILVFSVPFGYEEHIEHFPNLYDYKIEKKGDEYILHNKTFDDKLEIYDNLVFHGGPGETLEMRIFSKQSIENFLLESGFHDIIFHEVDEEMNKYGIFWENSCSLIVSALA